MILDIIDKYRTIINNFEVQMFKIVSSSYQLISNVTFVNNTHLFIKDYLFLDGTKKYSFHWQNNINECIVRWDNAPHHQDVLTYPFHRHIGKDEIIEDSEPMNIEKVFEFIKTQI